MAGDPLDPEQQHSSSEPLIAPVGTSDVTTAQIRQIFGDLQSAHCRTRDSALRSFQTMLGTSVAGPIYHIGTYAGIPFNVLKAVGLQRLLVNGIMSTGNARFGPPRSRESLFIDTMQDWCIVTIANDALGSIF